MRDTLHMNRTIYQHLHCHYLDESKYTVEDEEFCVTLSFWNFTLRKLHLFSVFQGVGIFMEHIRFTILYNIECSLFLEYHRLCLRSMSCFEFSVFQLPKVVMYAYWRGVVPLFDNKDQPMLSCSTGNKAVVIRLLRKWPNRS